MFEALPVLIYRNLRVGQWSIQAATGPQRGIVIAYASYAHITDVEPRINENGRLRTIQRQQKEVHAKLRGTLWAFAGRITERGLATAISDYEIAAPKGEEWVGARDRISYNPFNAGYFFRVSDGAPLNGASDAIFTPDETVFVTLGAG